jgi:uncharacterized oligopeptide transporter (OPT) family protein
MSGWIRVQLLNIGLGAAAAILSVVTAGQRIAHANSLTMASGGSTVFGFGAALSLVGAVTIIGAAVDVLTRSGSG